MVTFMGEVSVHLDFCSGDRQGKLGGTGSVREGGGPLLLPSER